MIRKILILAFLAFFFNCKNNNRQEERSVDFDNSDPVKSEHLLKEKADIEGFSVKLKGIIKKTDVFTLFYLDHEQDIYSASKIVNTEVQASNQVQEVIFKTPKDIYPYSFRLDFGHNKEQSEIEIYECILSYRGKKFKIKGGELQYYFSFNDGVKMQPDSTTFILSSFMSNGKDFYDPHIIGKPTLTYVLDFQL